MILLCAHPGHPIELLAAVAAMGGLGGTILWARCMTTTMWKATRDRIKGGWIGLGTMWIRLKTAWLQMKTRRMRRKTEKVLAKLVELDAERAGNGQR